MPQTMTLGTRFATALSEKDAGELRALLHPEVDFRGMTPSRFWEARGPDAVLEHLLGGWFEPKDEIESLDAVETDQVADRERVGYRVTVRNPDGRFLVEQQAYIGGSEDRIDWLRVMCSGMRPLA